MKEIKRSNGSVLTLEKVVVVNTYTNEFDGRKSVSAHLTQKRLTAYPAKRMDTGFGSGLFETEVGKPYEQTRNTLVSVPENTDVNQVVEQLNKFADACIYRIVSNNIDDVVSDREKQAIANGLIEKESLKPRYVVRDSEGNVYSNMTQDGERLEGDNRIIGKVVTTDEGQFLEITNPNALLEFKRDIFSREFVEDIDNREYRDALRQQVNVDEHENALPA